jgi:hypothetical protein
MLNENKVFADTITTQFDQYVSGGQDGAEEVNSSSMPPRAKRVSVPGLFHGKELNVLHLPSKAILVIEGSVIGYNQGHNVFGSCNVPALVRDAFKAAHRKRRVAFSAEEKRQIENEEHLTLKRLDVGVNLEVPEGVTPTRLLVELAHELIDKGIDTSTYGYGETVYRNQHSQGSSQKFYDKAKQLIDTKSLPADLPNREAILDFAKTVIRSEVVLRYPKLKAMDMTKPRDCTFQTLKAELESAFNRLNLRGSVRAGLSGLDLRDVKHMYRTTYRCWENGDDLTLLLEPKAYKRQVAYFAEELGFDITTPPPESNGDLVQLGDVFTLTNAVAPPPELWNGEDDAECALA